MKIIEPGAIKTEFFGRSLDVPERARASGDYGLWGERVFANIKAKCADAPGPELVAKASSRRRRAWPRWRMRYKPNGWLLILGRRWCRPRFTRAYRQASCSMAGERARLVVVLGDLGLPRSRGWP